VGAFLGAKLDQGSVREVGVSSGSSGGLPRC